MTVINANQAQQKALLERHLKYPHFSFLRFFFGINVNGIISKTYRFDDDNGTYYINLYLHNDKICEFQFREGDIPCFVKFEDFNGVRYDIPYPTDEMFDILKEEGLDCKNRFLTGIEI
jgi:hypothetical protein